MRPLAALAAAALLALAAACARAQDDKLNIWIVAHSHDDTGWLRTVDEYYVYEVQYILDSVVDGLAANPKRKFIEVEMAFFSRWWREQTAEKQALVRRLVADRQLVFVNGGWCMNDDAVPIYYAMIDQMTLGHEFITSQFGEAAAPTTGWHIDPFGHSNVIPTFYNATGFDQHIINRIDFRQKNELKAAKGMQFLWQGSGSLDTTMWTHIMDNHYCTPGGFNWEHGVTQNLPDGDGDEPVIVDPPSPLTANNELEIATRYVQMAKSRAADFRTKNILIPMGCDFTLQNANMIFKNVDRLIDAINKYSDQLGATAQYSSLDDFAAAVKADAPTAWPTYTDDFFPYADDTLSYWTGYFTSRQTVKATSRRAHALLRTTDFMHSFTRVFYPTLDSDAQLEALFSLKAPEAVVQHHDGVTGTFRQLVGLDYLKLLQGGMDRTDDVLMDNVGRMVTAGRTGQLTMNATAVDDALRAGRASVVVAQNAVSWPRTEYVRLVVYTSEIEVVSVEGRGLPFQVNERADGTYDVFVLVTVPGMGYTSFVVEPFTGETLAARPIVHRAQRLRRGEAAAIENEHVLVELSNTTQLITRITNKRTGAVVSGDHAPYVYTSWTGYQPSGAYIFRPVGPAVAMLTGAADVEVLTGPLVSEIRSDHRAQGSVQIARVYTGLERLEGSAVDIEHTLGPLSLDREVVLRFSTDIDNGDVMYTDNNGLEMQRRVNLPNGRPGDEDVGVRIAGNYYPAVSRAFIRDEADGRQLTVVTQTTHGVATLVNGQLEVMLHRRCSRDDARGMNEPLNDADVVTAYMRVFVDTPEESARLQHRHAAEVNFPLHLLFSTSSFVFPPSRPSFAPLAGTLPENLHVISLNPRNGPAGNAEVIVRLMHPFEAGEHPTLSQPVSYDVSVLFSTAGLAFANLRETTLTVLHTVSASGAGLREYRPTQIRTFVGRLVAA